MGVNLPIIAEITLLRNCRFSNTRVAFVKEDVFWYNQEMLHTNTMTAAAFIASVQAVSNIPVVLKKRLTERAGKLSSADRTRIVTELEQCEQREKDILTAGSARIAIIEKKISVRSRAAKEQDDRKKEESILPDFG